MGPRARLSSARVIDRRAFLAGSGALLALAACGSAPRRGVVRFSNWPYYIEESVLEDFERETGIAVRYTEDINDNDEFFAKIREPLSRGRSIDRDMIVLSDSTAARIVRLGWARELDRAAMPNASDVVPELRSPAFDPERRFTIPWLAGMTGLAYNVERAGRDLRSVNDVFDKRFAGRVSLLTEMEDTLGLVMLGLGAQPETATRADVEAAAERVRAARDAGQFRRFTGDDYGPDLARGDIWVAFGWSGDIVQLQRDNAALRFAIPDEGGLLWADEVIIPKGAANPRGAHRLIDFYYRPAVAAKVAAEVEFISPVNGVAAELAKIDPELARNPLIVPDEATRARLHSFRPLDEREEREFREIFQSVIRS